MLQSISSLWSKSAAQERQAKQRYAELVSASRAPILYTDFGIPDTLDGRFEAAILWLFIEEKRLGDDARDDWLRLLHEAFFADMDRSLREGGVGDTGISKRVQKMASAFYGRLSNYHDSWADEAAFKQKLTLNVYATRDVPPPAEAVQGLLEYIKNAIDA